MSPPRRGLHARPLLATALLGAATSALHLHGARLGRVFLDFGWAGFRPGWAIAVLLALAAMLGALATPSVPDRLGRVGAAVAFLLLTVVLAAGGVDDPPTALAVGLGLGALSAVAGFLTWGMEGEGGVVWIGAITAGCGGIVAGAFVGGALEEASAAGAGWATALSQLFGLGTLGLAGALPAALVLWAGERLRPYENLLFNALGGLVGGALLASIAVG